MIAFINTRTKSEMSETVGYKDKGWSKKNNTAKRAGGVSD